MALFSDETKKRNWSAARKMLRLADELGIKDHEIAAMLGKKARTIYNWRDGNRDSTPVPYEGISKVVQQLKEKKAARIHEQGNGVPVPAAPLLLEEKPLHREGSDAWRDGYATGFEAGIRYAERQAELKR